MLNVEKFVYEMFVINEVYRREKREIGINNIYKYFKVSRNCVILCFLGVLLNLILKDDCFQFCLEEEGCKLVGYMKDNLQICYMNFENRKDVGKFFFCGKVDIVLWDYYEKIKFIDYFLIFSKMIVKVLVVRLDYFVVLKMYIGDDN